MPQASRELRQKMCDRFTDIDLSGPQQYLQNRGYCLTDDYLWEPKPGVSSYADMTQDELDCLDFLCEEWDYGGLIEDAIPTTGVK